MGAEGPGISLLYRGSLLTVATGNTQVSTKQHKYIIGGGWVTLYQVILGMLSQKTLIFK